MLWVWSKIFEFVPLVLNIRIKLDEEGRVYTFGVFTTAYFEELFDILDLFRHFDPECQYIEHTSEENCIPFEVISTTTNLVVRPIWWGSHKETLPLPSPIKREKSHSRRRPRRSSTTITRNRNLCLVKFKSSRLITAVQHRGWLGQPLLIEYSTRKSSSTLLSGSSLERPPSRYSQILQSGRPMWEGKTSSSIQLVMVPPLKKKPHCLDPQNWSINDLKRWLRQVGLGFPMLIC